jgi:RNA polymerase sigma-70 factor, ECF subfamily
MEAAGSITGMRDACPARTLTAHATDEEAMARVRAGDAEALAVLFERYKSRLFAFLYRMLGERGAAEDLLGETFLRVYQHRARFRPGCGFAPWVYRIARNLAIQEARHRQVARQAKARLERESSLQREESPEAGAERAELRGAVLAALRGLPEEQRSAAILREYEGMDYREIAAVLGCTEQAARARTYRARLALRAALQERWGEDAR